MPPTDDKKDQNPSSGVDLNKILLPKKETLTGSPDTAQRVNAAELLAQEESAALPRPEPPAAAPAPVKQAPATPPESVLPLQTYKGDLEKVMHEGPGVSAVSIAAAEAERRSKEPLQPQETFVEKMLRWKSAFYIAGGVILLALAAGAVALVLLRPTSVPGPQSPVAPFIYIDDSRIVRTSSGVQAREQLMANLGAARQETRLSVGLIEWLFVAAPEPSADGGVQQLGVQALLRTLAPNVPEQLVRVLDGNYLLGLHSFDENQPLLLLRVDSYETAYSGMLAWESDVQKDLAPFFTRHPTPHIQSNTATTTASTTPQILPTGFVDRVVENRDARVMQNDQGDILLLWTFLGRNTILITTNEYTLREVLSRLKNTPVVPTPGR